ncbi:MAG TPA: hypothetical protein VF843_11550 [Streptosporangiaceae bacterium]
MVPLLVVPLAAAAPLPAVPGVAVAGSAVAGWDADASDVDRPAAGSIRMYGRPDRGWLYLAGRNALIIIVRRARAAVLTYR